MKKIIFVITIILCVLAGCKENSSIPKPKVYSRIDKPQYEFTKFEAPKFSFQYPNIASVNILPQKENNAYWFNLVYPVYKATLYCSYIPITKSSFGKALEDSYHLVYSHTLKADDIEETLYTYPQNKVSATIYNIDGSVATPIQFYATDSTKHFLRGSLYFDNQVNIDSVAPIINYIREDVEKIFQTLEWK